MLFRSLSETFDLVFIDAVKEEYEGYLDLALPKLRHGGVVVCDNLLWGGQVAGDVRSPDQTSSTEALRAFNRYFVNHPQLRAEVLAVGVQAGVQLVPPRAGSWSGRYATQADPSVIR